MIKFIFTCIIELFNGQFACYAKFLSGQERSNLSPQLLKISRITKFACEMLYNTENIVLQSLQIYIIFVLRAEEVVMLCPLHVK